MKSNKYINRKNNKISLTNIEDISSKRYEDLSSVNLYTSDYSTIVTNSNIFINKTPNLDRGHSPLSPNKNTFNTIEDNSKDIFYLSKLNLEHDIYLSSLKKKLAIIKEERKKSEVNVINAKKKIIELQKEEQKSLNELENTKKYIKKIIENRKKYSKKNFDIKIMKINNIFKSHKSTKNKLYHSGNLNFNTWLAPNKKKSIIKHQKSSHVISTSGIDNNSSYLYNKIKPELYENRNNTIENVVSYSALSHKKIYSRKKIKIKNDYFKNNKENRNYINYTDNNNDDTNNKIEKRSNKNKILKKSLIKKLKVDIEEKEKIKKQIEEIEKEQNKLYNNFYDKF